jgi:hypothetical protein
VNSPTVISGAPLDWPPCGPPCHSAATTTADIATAAIICVSGELVAAAVADLISKRRSNWLCLPKRALCAAPAPCRRTMRQASTFSSTT